MSIYSIPATNSFAFTLAEFAETLAADNNIPLSTLKIFLPTRRGIRTLQEAFLNLSNGEPRLLPLMQSIGDADLEEASFANPSHPDILPAIDPMRRQMVLARLLEQAWPHDYNYQQALGVAAELGALIDQVHTENLDPANLKDLVEVQEFAEHWEVTSSFLLLVLNDLWPAYLAEEGMIDPGLHRRKRITALTDFFKNNPPKTPVIVAGSTGSIPVTREFIRTIASLDNGMAVLPALDMTMDDKSWFKMEEGHPQHLLKILLDYCKTKREDVKSLSGETINAERLTLATEMMRPPETTDEWQALSMGTNAETIQNGLDGVTICQAENDHQEACVIALSMLEIAADPDQTKTATLITPDRYLAMRVQSILRQWGIDIDDSGGTSLTNTAIGQFCLSCLNTIKTGEVQPLPFLTTLKNPYAGGGDLSNFRNTARAVERKIFRGVRPEGDFSTLTNEGDRYNDFFTYLQDAYDPIMPLQRGAHSLQKFVTAHLKIMEKMAATHDISGADRLWSGDAGEALANFFSSLQMHADVTPDMTLSDYIDMIGGFLANQTFTAKYGKHPRLSILGQIEARMVQADRVILSGLNEGIWPPDAGFDTWMSRPMRSRFGLPSLEQKTTLAAHDFMTAFCAPEVFITRSEKSGGQPTLPSRWLNRLRTVLQAAQIKVENWPHAKGMIYTHWAKKLIETEAVSPIARPSPAPALARRPTEFSVTEIEKWMRDPYWIYAKKILNLRPLDPVDMDVGAADRGTLIHDTMEKFTTTYSDKHLPDQALEKLLAIGEKEFATHAQNAEVQGFWWPRFTRAADWFITHETDWRRLTATIKSEIKGGLDLAVADTMYRLKGKADRIETREDGTYAIIDYKTGAPPKAGDVLNGLASQLPLETLILQDHGFDMPYREGAVTSLYYWNLSGSGDGGAATLAQGEKGPETHILVEEARLGVTTLFEAYHNDNTPYLGSPDPDRMIIADYNDYAHLERISEWSVTGDNGEAA